MSNRKAVTRIGIAGLGVLLALACVEETPALFIVQNSVLDSNCRPVFQANVNEALASGAMDLTVARTYTMFPRVENLMSPSGSVSLGGGGATGGSTYEGNRVTLTRAEVSFSGPSDFSVVLPRGIEIPIAGTIEPNGEAIVELVVINQALGNQLASSVQLADRGSEVTVRARLKFFGVSTSGTSVETNTFTYPLRICRGCLLEFPPEASDPLDVQPNCLADISGDSSVDLDLTCYPGQDKPLDCRACRILVTSQGADAQEVNEACEPAPGQ